jgi:hypothetical protein
MSSGMFEPLIAESLVTSSNIDIKLPGGQPKYLLAAINLLLVRAFIRIDLQEVGSLSALAIYTYILILPLYKYCTTLRQ